LYHSIRHYLWSEQVPDVVNAIKNHCWPGLINKICYVKLLPYDFSYDLSPQQEGKNTYMRNISDQKIGLIAQPCLQMMPFGPFTQLDF
jgi:hypothetical protein